MQCLPFTHSLVGPIYAEVGSEWVDVLDHRHAAHAPTTVVARSKEARAFGFSLRNLRLTRGTSFILFQAKGLAEPVRIVRLIYLTLSNVENWIARAKLQRSLSPSTSLASILEARQGCFAALSIVSFDVCIGSIPDS